MRIRKLLPVLCMALGLTMAAPLAAGATGNTDAGTVSGTTQDTQTTNATGWHENDEDGSRYYTINGKIVTGFQWIANSTGQKNLYYFNPDTGLLLQSKAAGRIKIGNDYYYTFGPTGNCAIATTQGWIRTEGNSKAYYVSGPSNNGKLLANQVAKIGKLYYGFNKYGQRWAAEGRRRLGTKVYYVTSGGFLRANKWQKIKIGGVTRSYYFNSQGEMTGLCKRVVNNKTLYYQVDATKSNYPLQSVGWHKDYLNRQYYVTSIYRLAIGFKKIDGNIYYFNTNNGMLVTKRWIISNRKAYYATKTGAIQTGWYRLNSKQYYADSTGARVTGLQTINSKTYYFNAAGVVQTGWKTLNGKRYYFAPNFSGTSYGMARTGWFNLNNNIYYANADGSLVTGWVLYNNNRYYLDPNNGGAAIRGKTVSIGGVTYTFDSEGRQTNWVPDGAYSIKVDRQRNMVAIYKGSYLVKVFLCSTGLNNATPTGTFRLLDKLSIHELNGPTWGYYCSHITSDILFHSLPGNAPSHYAFPAHKYNLLGQQASQGCIRLRMGDAYWLYKNVPTGTTVTVGDYIIPSSVTKPTYQTIPENLTVDPTDPTDATNRRYAPDYTG